MIFPLPKWLPRGYGRLRNLGWENILYGCDRIQSSMKQVFVSQNLFEVEMRKEWLEQAGIRCTIKNQRISGLAGEIPFTETFPELWVIQNEDYDQARRVLEEGLVLLPSDQDTWTCAGCGECHESQFGTCWKCGRARPPG